MAADAAKFRSTWNGQYRKMLATSLQALTDGAGSLRKNADEQDKASEGGGRQPGAHVGGNPFETFYEQMTSPSPRQPAVFDGPGPLLKELMTPRKLPAAWLPLRESLAESNAAISLSVIKLGIDKQMIFTQYADGHVAVTQLDSAELSASKLLDIGLHQGKGKVWVVTGPDAMEKARTMMEHMYRLEMPRPVQINVIPPSVVRVGPPPDMTFEARGADVGRSMEFGDEGKGSLLDGHETGVLENHVDGTTTRFYDIDTKLAAGLRAGLSMSGEGSFDNRLAITRDPGGDLVQIELTETSRLDAGAGVGFDVDNGKGMPTGIGFDRQHHFVNSTQMTMTVTLSDDGDRSVVEHYLKGHGGHDMPAAGSPLGRLLHDKGTVSRINYEGGGHSFDLKGVYKGFGTEAGDQYLTTHATDVKVLGRPDAHGDRHWIEPDAGPGS